MKRIQADALLAMSALVCCGAWAGTADTYHVDAEGRVTVGQYAWAAGRVCFSIENGDGSPGVVKMWTLGLSDIEERVYRGSACFPVIGFAHIRAGHAPAGPVTVRVAHDSVTGLPFISKVR